MLHRVVRALVIAVACLLATAASAAERVALLIGNAAYTHVPALPNPVNDAASLGTSLERLGFTVEHADNLDYDAMRRVLIDFSSRAAGAEIALVFYAGHGIEIDRQNYLVPVDARLASDRAVMLEAIPLDTVLMAVEGATKLKVVLLDACRDNPFVNQMRRSGATRSIGRGLARVEPNTGTLIGFAAKEGTTANDGDGAHSPYTQALLDNVEQPGLEISLMFRRIRDSVLKETGGQQEPFAYGSLPSENIYLVPPGATGAPEPQSPPQALVSAPPEDRQVWETIKDTSSAAVLSSFVARYPGSVYAELAKARLEEIRAEQAEKKAEKQAALPPPAAPPPVEETRRPTGSWFVIMGSYKHNDRGRAVGRRDQLLAKGVDAYLIDTDDYSNLTNGLYAVVLGPYSKSEASAELARVKRHVGDAYIKSGN